MRCAVSLWLMLFCSWCSLCSAKTALGVAQLTGMNTEVFLGKFAFNIGQGQIHARLSLAEPYIENSRSLHLYYYCDEEWEEAKSLMTCVDKTKLARTKVFVDFSASVGDNTIDLHLPSDTVEYWVGSNKINQNIRTHYWYAFIADCSLEMYQHKVPPIRYNMTFLNEPGDQHLPADERGMFLLHFCNFSFVLVVQAFTLFRAWSQCLETGNIHLAVILLIMALAASMMSSFCELLHLQVYAMNGRGMPFFDVISALTEASADLLLTFILLSISAGWTLGSSLPAQGFRELGFLDFDPQPTARAGSMDPKKIASSLLSTFQTSLRSPLGLLTRVNAASIAFYVLVAFHYGLVLWSACFFADDFDKFHDHEHLPGTILMWTRVLLGALFVVAINRLLGMGVGGGLSLFLRQFRFAGCAWFLSMPVDVVIASLFAPYLRHQVVTGGSLVCQSLCLAALAWLFVGSRNTFFYKRSSVGAASGGLGLNAGLDGGGKTISLGRGVRTHCD